MEKQIKDEIKFLEDFSSYFNCDLDYIMQNHINDRIELLKNKLKKLKSK